MSKFTDSWERAAIRMTAELDQEAAAERDAAAAPPPPAPKPADSWNEVCARLAGELGAT